MEDGKSEWGISTIDVIDRRINEHDRRSNTDLAFKLEAMEKLFSMTVAVRSEALAIALSKLETDGRTFESRCSMQVHNFYNLINEQKERTSLLAKDVAALQGYEEKVTSMMLWKNGFWVRNIISAIVVTVAVSQLLFYLFTWVIDFFSKIKGGI